MSIPFRHRLEWDAALPNSRDCYREAEPGQNGTRKAPLVHTVQRRREARHSATCDGRYSGTDILREARRCRFDHLRRLCVLADKNRENGNADNGERDCRQAVKKFIAQITILSCRVGVVMVSGFRPWRRPYLRAWCLAQSDLSAKGLKVSHLDCYPLSRCPCSNAELLVELREEALIRDKHDENDKREKSV